MVAEMQVLGWIGKPVLVPLNQLGPPRPVEVEAAEVARWSGHLSGFPWAPGTIGFDAFARLAEAWKARNRGIFAQSMQVLARQLAATAADSAVVAARGAATTARSWLGSLLGVERRGDAAADAAMGELAQRLDAGVRRATDELIVLHGLSGKAAAEVLQRMGAQYAVDKAADPGNVSLIGAAISGALGGLAADLAAGGLTFGAGLTPTSLP